MRDLAQCKQGRQVLLFFLCQKATVFLLFSGLVTSAVHDETNNVLRTGRLFLKTI